MTPPPVSKPHVAIACGGTGGHLFPGLAVAEQLTRRGCNVTLLISPKDVDQQAVKSASGMNIVTLPAVGLTGGRRLAFVRGFVQSYRAARKFFKRRPPQAALAMGGFTSAPPILAAKGFGARTFLHESNTIPGRANRWLSWVVDQAFVGFPQAGARLHNRNVTVTGTPVRPQFQPQDAAACRAKLFVVPPLGGSPEPPKGGTPNPGVYDPSRPVLLVMGGSQGASGINDLVIKTLPLLAKSAPQLQLFHLSGPNDAEKVRSACAALNVPAVVHSFFAEMELALGAATVCISRAGASSLAELAAMRVPPVLIPYPAATDNHQLVNAQAFEQTGAARLIEQRNTTPEILASLVLELVENAAAREKMQAALAKWHAPKAAEQIAETILAAIARSADSLVHADQCGCGTRGPSGPRSKDAGRQNFSAA